MHRIISAIIVFTFISLAFACGGSQNTAGGGGTSPTDAYKKVFAAVTSKDVEAIKKLLTKKSLELGVVQSQRTKKPIEQVYENAFTATTFSETLPSIRDERINGDMGSIEVWNSKESKWEDLPFIKEDGGWKLAIGDLFSGSFVSPGQGRDFLEKQAANAVSNQVITLGNGVSNANSSTNSGPVVPPANRKSK